MSTKAVLHLRVLSSSPFHSICTQSNGCQRCFHWWHSFLLFIVSVSMFTLAANWFYFVLIKWNDKMWTKSALNFAIVSTYHCIKLEWSTKINVLSQHKSTICWFKFCNLILYLNQKLFSGILFYIHWGYRIHIQTNVYPYAYKNSCFPSIHIISVQLCDV